MNEQYIKDALRTDCDYLDVAERLEEFAAEAALAVFLDNAKKFGEYANEVKRCVIYGKKVEVDGREVPAVPTVPTLVAWKIAGSEDRVIPFRRRVSPDWLRTVHAVLGLMSECAETVELLLNSPDGRLPRDEMREETGDKYWYLALLTAVVGTSPRAIAEANIAKLEKRYGKTFSGEVALGKRDYAAEAAAMRTAVDCTIEREGSL